MSEVRDAGHERPPGAPSISIIMNIRDGGPWLAEALDSVLAQTFGDWELIAWDDGSTDNSADIVGRCLDPRIRYFLTSVEQGYGQACARSVGLGRARQLAVEAARGEWLAFLDQDDIWLPDKLEKQTRLIAERRGENLGIVYGRSLIFSDGQPQRDADIAHEFGRLPEGDIFLGLFRDSCFITVSSCLLRRSAFFDIGGIPPEFDLSSDYHLFIAIARRYTAAAVQEVVCLYRVHDDSLSRVARRRLHEEALSVVDHWNRFLPPELVARCRARHHSAIAVEDLRHWSTLFGGVRRLRADASLRFLLMRPFARLWRSVRRNLKRPYWKSGAPGVIREEREAAGADSTPSLPASGAPLDLSVIVVNWKVRDLLRECLQSLYEQITLRDDEWEVVVVDNASQDGAVEMIRQEFPAATVLVNTRNIGFAAANNQALPFCRGNFVLLLNPDARLVGHAVEGMLQLMQAHADAAAVGCRLINPDGTIQRFTGGNFPQLGNIADYFLFGRRMLPRFLRPAPLFLEIEPVSPAPVGWVSGACMLLRREAVGTRIFEPSFFLYGEDIALCDRLARAGWKILYTPTQEVIHHGGSSRKQQAPDLQLRNIRGLREAYALHKGVERTHGFDLLLSLAFLVRTLVFGAAACVRPGRGFDDRAAISFRHAVDAVRALFGGERAKAGAPPNVARQKEAEKLQTTSRTG